MNEGAKDVSIEVPLTRRVEDKIEEIAKAQAVLRIEVESITRLLFPEALPEEKSKVAEEAKNSDRGWFDRTRHELHAVLKFEQSTSAMLHRLRTAIEPKNKLSPRAL